MKNNYLNIFKDLLEEPVIKKYYDSTPNKIIFSSDSLFTKKFVNDLDSLLNKKGNSGKKFKKLSIAEKKDKVSELENLLQTESMWKNLVKSSKFNPQKILEIFPKEAEQFFKAYKEGFFPTSKDKLKRQKDMRGSGKAKIYLKGLFSYIKEEKSEILNEEGKNSEYTEERLDKLVKEISPTLLFQDLVKISMKKAYDTNINIESNNPRSFHNKPLNSNFLRAKKTEIRYPTIKYINIFLTSHLINDLAKNKLLVDNQVDFIIKVLKAFDDVYRKEASFQLRTEEGNDWYLLGIDITEILLYFFEYSGVIKKKYLEKIKSGSKKTNTIYIFDHKLDNSISFSENLPRIIPPIKAETNRCAYQWISPVKRGEYNVQLSDQALSALNNAQKKEFSINQKYLKLLKHVDNTREFASEFPTKAEFSQTQQHFEEWANSSWNSVLDIMFYKISRGVLRVKKFDEAGLHSRILKVCKLSHLESHANASKNYLRTELIKKRTMRQLLLTSIEIANLYRDYPLYYGTLLDFRLRMYPLQYLLSRTSGYLKNSLSESKQKKVSERGLKYMLEAYYAPDKSMSLKFKTASFNKFDDMLTFLIPTR